MVCSKCPYMIFVMSCLHCIWSSHLVNGSTPYRIKRFTKADICHETNATLQLVEKCPITELQIDKLSQKKKCHSYPPCNGEPLVYHCVRFKDKLAEVCAPRHIITGKCCALYDEGLGRVVEDYDRPCSECSFRYRSDDAVKYSKCTEINKKGKVCKEENVRSKRNSECDKGQEIDSSGKMKEDDSPISINSVVVPAVVGIVLLLAAIGVIYTCFRKRKDVQYTLPWRCVNFKS